MIRARYAALLDRGLTKEQIADLTPRQINEFYFHPRDKDGAILEPKAPRAPREATAGAEGPPTLNGILFELDCLMAKGAITRENYEEQVRVARQKYGEKHGENDGGDAASVGQ